MMIMGLLMKNLNDLKSALYHPEKYIVEYCDELSNKMKELFKKKLNTHFR